MRLAITALKWATHVQTREAIDEALARYGLEGSEDLVIDQFTGRVSTADGDAVIQYEGELGGDEAAEQWEAATPHAETDLPETLWYDDDVYRGTGDA